MINLTRREQEVLDYINSYHSKRGFFPTSREINDQFNFRSYKLAAYYLRVLREKKCLKKLKVA